MTAREIIHEIRLLSPSERAEVVNFIHAIEKDRQFPPHALEELALKLAGEQDPGKAAKLKEEISSGFYGRGDA